MAETPTTSQQASFCPHLLQRGLVVDADATAAATGRNKNLDDEIAALVREFGLVACQESLQKQLPQKPEETSLPDSITGGGGGGSLRRRSHSFSSLSSVDLSYHVRNFFDSTSSTTQQRSQRVSILHDDNRLKKAMLDASFDSMFAVCGNSGIIQAVNAAAVKEFGYENAQEMVGQNVAMIVGGGHAELHQAYMDRYMETGESHLIGTLRELSARRKDGSEFPCLLGFAVIELEDGSTGESKEKLFYTCLRNVTREKETRLLLVQNAREKKIKAAILDAAMDAIFATEVDGKIMVVNRAALKAFGYDNESELIGQNVNVLVGGGHCRNHGSYVKKFAQTKGQDHKYWKMRREVQARRKDGSEFPAMLGLEQVFGDEEKALLVVATIQDLSMQKLAMELEVQKRAAEELLLNMLPEEIALRLKDDPSQYLADHHNDATILFADIVGFTSLSSTLKPIQIVRFLNDLFTRFDHLVDKYKLNKIKTIGDCYMVTSIPGETDSKRSCASVCHFAFDMIQALKSYNKEHPERKLDLRVGINAGPVVAGVVGTKRFLYDIWGDAVNLASRMESTGVPGCIQVTKEVIELVPENEFRYESRGKIAVKGKGTMETFLLLERCGSSDPYILKWE